MKKALTLIYLITVLFAKADSWTLVTNYPGIGGRFKLSFSIGNIAYVGCGFDTTIAGNTHNDFWEYDPAINVWTQKANVGGVSRGYGVGFSILNKGYAGIGFQQGQSNLNDFWEYEPATNVWTQRANFGGGYRRGAIGFSIGNMGYIGTGEDMPGNYYNDLWQYNPVTDSWVQKSGFAGTPRSGANCFVIGNYAYIIGGDYVFNDLWQYNSTTDIWLQKANLPAAPGLWGAAFTLCDKGYYGTGSTIPFNDFWQYDPVFDSWIQKTDFPGPDGIGSSFFSIGSKGYIGSGSSNYNFYEYTPDSICITGMEEISNLNFEFSISPNPAIDFIIIDYPISEKENLNLAIIDANGKSILKTQLNENTNQTVISINKLSNGIYFVELKVGNKNMVRKFLKI